MPSQKVAEQLYAKKGVEEQIPDMENLKWKQLRRGKTCSIRVEVYRRCLETQ